MLVIEYYHMGPWRAFKSLAPTAADASATFGAPGNDAGAGWPLPS